MESSGSQAHTHPVASRDGGREMDHWMHRPGTMRDCGDCESVTYEPGWYASLLAVALRGELMSVQDGADTVYV